MTLQPNILGVGVKMIHQVIKGTLAIFAARFLTDLTFCAYLFRFAPKFCLYCTHK